MAQEKEKKLIDYIKLVSPGSPLRNVINDLISSGLGAILILESPEIWKQGIAEGGFKINCRFTSQRLFELCKMDGAIIISQDLKRILYANTTMAPNHTIRTTETGTRHRAAERTAKQAGTFVIAVSERKKKTTLYYESSRYYLKSMEELFSSTNSAISTLESQKEKLKEHASSLNILEMSDLVSVSDVCKVIQKTEMMLKISESVKKNFTELGKEGNILHMRYRELIRGLEKTQEGILRDYAVLTLKKSKTLLSNLTLGGLLDLELIARLILEKDLTENISPKGYRFLEHLTLSKKESSSIVNKLLDLKNILQSSSQNFESILKNRSKTIQEEISNLREQILSGKVVC